MSQFDDLFEKLSKKEDEFFNSTFLSPVIKGQSVRVRIDGVILNLKIVKPKNFEGWGVFSPKNFKEAILVRKATLAEKEEYLNLFPRMYFILCRQVDKRWYGTPAFKDDRFKITGLVPISFAEEVQTFDVIQTRFDGQNVWFDGLYEKGSLKNIQYLRESFANLLEPKSLNYPSLTDEQKNAYNIVYLSSEDARKNKEESRIKEAVSRAGGVFRNYTERGTSYVIEYLVGSEVHKSAVDKNTLTVQSAGICLSGGDRNFDLQSLVGVIREGQNRHLIHRVGF